MQTPDKRDVMLDLLQHFDSVLVHFDPRMDGVMIPPHFRHQPHLVLQYGHQLAVPIPDLDVGEKGITATLSFQRRPVYTFVPWSAVFMMVSSDQTRGARWDADIPGDLQSSSKPVPAKKEAAKPKLQAVKSPPSEPESSQGSKVQDEPRKASLSVAPPAPNPPVQSAESTEKQAVSTSTASTPAETDSPAPEPTKKKRELPSYLRVVK